MADPTHLRPAATNCDLSNPSLTRPTSALQQQTVELLRQEVELDDETKQLMASLRDQLNDITANVNAVI